MKFVFYTFLAALGVLVATFLELRAGHLYRAFPAKTSELQTYLPTSSGFISGQFLIDDTFSIAWKEARICGLAVCWKLALMQNGRDTVTGLARAQLLSGVASVNWTSGEISVVQALSTLGQISGIFQTRPGNLHINLWSREFQSLELEAQIAGAMLGSAVLGSGPLTLRLVDRQSLQGRFDLSGGAASVEATLNASVAEGSGLLEVRLDSLEAFDNQTAARLRRLMTFHQGQHVLSARLDLSFDTK